MPVYCCFINLTHCPHSFSLHFGSVCGWIILLEAIVIAVEPIEQHIITVWWKSSKGPLYNLLTRAIISVSPYIPMKGLGPLGQLEVNGKGLLFAIPA